MHLTIEDILKAVNGVFVAGSRGISPAGISTDTRTLKKGDFYVALKGPRFDGHDYVGSACAKGAVGAIVSKNIETTPGPSFAVVVVDNTLKALGDLALYYRKQFLIPVVAITGSSGKTTTREMLSACLATSGRVCKTEGNLNNLIGLPLTLFGLNKGDRYAVLEMGMNAFGEIARLTEIASPTIGLVTNIGPAHLEGVGNLSGVAKAKGELFLGLQADTVAVVNKDDLFIPKMKTPAKKITFGFSKDSDICCEAVKYFSDSMEAAIRDTNGRKQFHLPFVGEHHVRNWLACHAICIELGISTAKEAEGLARFRQGKMRGEELKFRENIVVVDDTYNANPDSTIAGFCALRHRFPGRRKIAVLGDMLELGKEAVKFHREVGKKAAELGIEILLACGDYAHETAEGFYGASKNGTVFEFTAADKLNEKLGRVLKKGDVVLVKGSRGSRMEKAVEYLESVLKRE